MSELNILVKCCSDCPFLQDTFGVCELEYNYFATGKSAEECVPKFDYFNGGYEVPIWCKLKNNNINIKLKQ